LSFWTWQYGVNRQINGDSKYQMISNSVSNGSPNKAKTETKPIPIQTFSIINAAFVNVNRVPKQRLQKKKKQQKSQLWEKECTPFLRVWLGFERTRETRENGGVLGNVEVSPGETYEE